MPGLRTTLTRTFENITTPGLLRVAAVIITAAWLGSFVLHQARARGDVDSRGAAVGGDFLVFYTAGELVRSGAGSRLYDAEAQRGVQARILGEGRPGLYYFINPAPFALLYAPMALLPFRAAFLLHTAMMALLGLAGLFALRPHLPRLRQAWGTTVLLGLSSFPLVHTILGGQNAPVALALLCLVYAALRAGKEGRAGLWLGLLLYKPQYVATLLVLLASRRRWKVVAVAIVTGVALYIAGTLTCGWDWPLRMLESMGGFYRQHERVFNGPTHVALPEVVDWSLIMPLEGSGAPRAAILAVRGAGWVAIVMILLAVIWRWRDAEPTAPRFAVHFALASAATVVTGLHAQYYDAALLLLPVLLLIDFESPRGDIRAALILVYMLFPLVILGRISELIRFQPAALIPVGCLLWAWRSLRRGPVTR